VKNSLSILSLVDFARHEWANNPLVHVMKRKVRRFYVYIIAFQVIVFTFFQIVPGMLAKAWGPSGIMTIILPVVYLSNAFVWLMIAIAPIFYANWAYREVWTKDETLRVSQLTFRDWLAAIMLPLMQLVGVMFFVGCVLHLITSANVLWNLFTMTPKPLSSARIHFVFQWVFAMLSTLINSGMYVLLAITVWLRRIMQLAEGRSTVSALPRLALPIAVFTGVLLFCGVSQLLFGGIFGWGLLISLLPLLMEIFSLAAIFALASYVWKRDLRVARTFLFSASCE